MSPEGAAHRLDGRSLLELFALTGFAVAQPLLSVFGRSPDYFIFHDASAAEIIAFAAVVTVLPAVVLWLGEVAVGLVSTRARRVMHVLVLTGLTGLVAVQVLKKATPLRGGALVIVSATLAVLAALIYLRVRLARLYLLFVSPAPVAFALLFLLTSPVSKLVLAEEIHTTRLGSPTSAPSVVVITFDEWPTASIVNAKGAIDADLFPHLAAFAHDATWYRNSTSVTSSTWYAVPAILTGKYPKDGELPEASSHPENLFTFLGRTHRLRMSETVTRLCPSSLCTTMPSSGAGDRGMTRLLKDGAKTYRSMVAPRTTHSDVTAGFEERETKAAVAQARGSQDHANVDLGVATANRPERFNQLLDSIHAGEKPTLHFLHILLPHVAYRYLPSGQQYPSPDTDFGKQDDNWTDQAWPPALAHERMLLQVGYVDRLVGELVDRLKQRGLYDRTVVVITADHGIAFDPGGPARGLSDRPVPTGLYPQILWAPLIVKASGQTTGRVSDANVMSVDLLPTIADLVGFELPWKVDGVSAVGAPRPTGEKIFLKATVNGFGVGLGPPIRFDGRGGEQAMLAGNVDAITDPGAVPPRLWRVRPRGELVGRTVDELGVGNDSGLDAKVHQPDAFAAADPASGTVPALVWGQVTHGLGAGRAAEIVVAVNGTIAGVSPTFRDGDTELRFAAMVPDALIHSGANDLRLYTVTGSVGAVTLHPVHLVTGRG